MAPQMPDMKAEGRPAFLASPLLFLMSSFSSNDHIQVSLFKLNHEALWIVLSKQPVRTTTAQHMHDKLTVHSNVTLGFGFIVMTSANMFLAILVKEPSMTDWLSLNN